MYGRNGNDPYNRFILGVAFVCLILSIFVKGRLVYYVALGLLIYCYYRLFSRNIAARQKENARYLSAAERIKRVFRINRKRIADRGEFRYFKCPGCGQQVRVPKGRGHIMITCPKCKKDFEKTT